MFHRSLASIRYWFPNCDYEALSERLTLRSAICIQPLTSEQIEQYLARASDQLAALKTVLQQDLELRSLATSPLVLSIMSLTYQGCSLEELPRGGTADERYRRLFDNYIERMFQRRQTTKQPYPKHQTITWLTWLARQMAQASQTVFLIERMQLSWLETTLQKWSYIILFSLSISLSIGGAFNIFLTPIFAGLLEDMNVRSTANFLETTISLFFLFIAACFMDKKIEPVEKIKFSFSQAKSRFISGLMIGVSFGLVASWKTGILMSTIFVVISGLSSGLRGSTLETTSRANQGVWKSMKNAVFLGFLGAVVIYSVAFTLFDMEVSDFESLAFLIIGFIVLGLVCGWAGGGEAAFKHFILRLILFFNRNIAWNYSQFLDYATERIFLQKVGGGYIFVHRMLLEHFAQMELEQGKVKEEDAKLMTS